MVGLSAVYVAYDLHQTSKTLRGDVPDLTETVTKANQVIDTANSTLTALNAPCVGFHGSVTCGPLAQLSQTEKNIGILAGQTVEQVRQTGSLVTATATTMTEAGDSIRDVAGKLSGTATAATGLLSAGQTDLETAQPSIAALQPLLSHFDAAVADFDGYLKDNAVNVRLTLADLRGMADSGNGVMFDFREVADKETANYLKPVRWYMQPVRRFGEVWDIGAAVARHTP